jgi:hypothetical protein
VFGIGVQELIIVPITLALFAVLIYGAVTTILSIIRPSLVGQKSVSCAFAYAVAWGGLTIVLPFVATAEYPSLGIAIAISILGAIQVALGFAVRRRSQMAAWGLVVFALLDILIRISTGTTGFLMPLILLVLSFPAAIYLRRQSLPTSPDEVSSESHSVKEIP